MRRVRVAMLLVVLCALPLWADQKVGTVNSGGEAADLTVKTGGAKCSALLEFYTTGNTYRLGVTLDPPDLDRMVSLLNSANSFDLEGCPVNRHISLGDVKGVTVEVGHGSGSARTVSIVNGGHRVVMDGPTTDHFMAMLNDSRRVVLNGGNVGGNDAGTPGNTGQTTDDATRILKHWHPEGP